MNRILLLSTCLFVLYGCFSSKNKLIPTANKGGYKVTEIRAKSKRNSNEVTITGTVFDIKTGKSISPPVLLTSGCIKIQASSKGEYSFKTTNFKDDYFFIEVIAVGYRTIETNFINIHNRNEVKIDFYLAEDDRPFIDCPPAAVRNVQ